MQALDVVYLQNVLYNRYILKEYSRSYVRVYNQPSPSGVNDCVSKMRTGIKTVRPVTIVGFSILNCGRSRYGRESVVSSNNFHVLQKQQISCICVFNAIIPKFVTRVTIYETTVNLVNLHTILKYIHSF